MLRTPGFGTVTRNVGLRLLEAGVDIRFVSQNVSMDPIPPPLGERTWDIAKIAAPIPTIFAKGFNDAWKPEACVILGDYAAVRGTVLNYPQLTRSFQSIPTFHYCPVEGVGLPPRWKGLWDVVQPVAMSNFGAAEIAKVTGPMPPMIYHGVSTDDFYPVAHEPARLRQGDAVRDQGRTPRRCCQYPGDRVMVLRTDRHMPRKRITVPPPGDGPGLRRLRRRSTSSSTALGGPRREHQGRRHEAPRTAPGARSADRAHDTWKGLPRTTLNVLYNAADIYASTSAEGFGLTIAEAIAAAFRRGDGLLRGNRSRRRRWRPVPYASSSTTSTTTSGRRSTRTSSPRP